MNTWHHFNLTLRSRLHFCSKTRRNLRLKFPWKLFTYQSDLRQKFKLFMLHKDRWRENVSFRLSSPNNISCFKNIWWRSRLKLEARKCRANLHLRYLDDFRSCAGAKLAHRTEEKASLAEFINIFLVTRQKSRQAE